MTDADLSAIIQMLRGALGDAAKNEFVLTVTRPTLEMMLDFFTHLDPDMPSAALCKALGPLVGDVVMNRKLQRLNDIADVLGPNVLRLAMIVDQLDRR